jgi:CheY-like chemotaxis protein
MSELLIPGAGFTPNELPFAPAIDPQRDPALDQLARLAALALNAPIVNICLESGNQPSLRAVFGMDLMRLSVDRSFHTSTLVAEGLNLVVDATQDPRFKHNTLVVSAPGLRFYAGAPLRLDGCTVGTLSVCACEVRELRGPECVLLLELARMVELWLQAHAERVPVERGDGTFESADNTTDLGEDYDAPLSDLGGPGPHPSTYAAALAWRVDELFEAEIERAEPASKSFSPVTLVEQVCAPLLSLAADWGVLMLVFCDPLLPPWFRGNGLKLRQVVLGLAGHALEACAGRERSGLVSIRCQAQPEGLRLIVAHNGAPLSTQQAQLLDHLRHQGELFGDSALVGHAFESMCRLVLALGGSVSRSAAALDGVTLTVDLPLPVLSERSLARKPSEVPAPRSPLPSLPDALLQELRDAVHSGEWQRAARLARDIKGASRVLGAELVSGLFGAAQQARERGDGETLAQIEADIGEAVASLHQHLDPLQGESAAPPRPHVICLDQNPKRLSDLRAVLREAGSGEVDCFARPQDLLRQLKGLVTSATLLVLDLPLPQNGGAELLPQLQAHGYQGRIAFVAESNAELLAQAERQARSLGLGLAGHLQRRVSEQDAMALLRGLDGGPAETAGAT